MFRIELVDRSGTMSTIDMANHRVWDAQELDCPEAYQMWVCEILEAEKAAELIISGFGVEHWPTQFGYEGSLFLDSLPNAIARLERRSDFVISIPAQGTEADFSFDCSDDLAIIHVRCESPIDRPAGQNQENVEYVELLKMLTNSRDRFRGMVRRLLPRLYEQPLMPTWFSRFD